MTRLITVEGESNNKGEDAMSTKSEVRIAHLRILDILMPDIQNGTAIPIISNSLRLEEFFRGEKELLVKIKAEKVEFDDEENTIDEKLTKEWAKQIRYPMPDDHNLARVAQYHQVKQDNNEIAKSEYLAFLKTYMLDIPKNSRKYAEYISGVKNQIKRYLFSTIAKSLDYPRFSEKKDPLAQLAKLPLKVFITTSYFNFLERALEKERGEKPHTLVCFWNRGESKALPIHREVLDPDQDITEKTPLVYHLFGLENYPNTLVLSEDDYMNFLVSVFEDTNTTNPIIPNYLKGMLAERKLILFGYHLQDWDFRVLFKFIMKFRRRRSEDDDMPRGILIQLKPSPKQAEDEESSIKYEERSIKYLEQYFGKKQFDVDWTYAENFIHELVKRYDDVRGKM